MSKPLGFDPLLEKPIFHGHKLPEIADVNEGGKVSGSILKYDTTSGKWKVGVDNDTLFTAGTGLSLSGTQFSLDSSYVTNNLLKLDQSTPQTLTASPIFNNLTAGRIPFASGTKALTDDSNLFWDNTNKRLGIGTTSPRYPLDINGTSMNLNGGLLTVDNTADHMKFIYEPKDNNKAVFFRITPQGSPTYTYAGINPKSWLSLTSKDFNPNTVPTESLDLVASATKQYIITRGYSTAPLDLSFATLSDPTISEKMVIQASTGNVGIGTSIPDKPLSFASNYFGISKDQSSNFGIVCNAYHNGTNWKISTGGYSYDASMITLTGDNIYFRTYNGSATDETITWVNAMAIRDTNNVLVGTDTDGMTTGGSLAIAKDLAHRGTKVGFYNTTPIEKPTTSISSATFTENSGTAVNDASTFGGYTIGQVVKALVNLGLLS